MNIFVYGSLKKGYWNHDLLQESHISFVGKGTIKGYSLYHVATYPGMIKSTDPEEIVYGEVYNVTLGDIRALDNLEREGYLYKRIPTIAKVKDEEIGVSTYLYLFDVEDSLRVEDNDWKGYHGKTKKYGKIKP